MVYGETFLRNFKFYAKTLTTLHDLTVYLLHREGGEGEELNQRDERDNSSQSWVENTNITSCMAVSPVHKL
jgi:hypothetical protein